MTETAAPLKLTQHQARILTAAIAGYLGLVCTGEVGGDFTNSLSRSAPREYEMILGARSMLARSKEGMTEDSATFPTAETFVDNLEQLNALGLLLSGPASTGVEAEVEPVQVVTDIDKDGNEIGAKRYALWVTHDEMHLLHWALKTAEAIGRKDPSFIPNGLKYASLRREVVDDSAFGRFVDKFDNVHQQARVDDGEDVGVEATPATQSQPEPPAATA